MALVYFRVHLSEIYPFLVQISATLGPRSAGGLWLLVRYWLCGASIVNWLDSPTVFGLLGLGH